MVIGLVVGVLSLCVIIVSWVQGPWPLTSLLLDVLHEVWAQLIVPWRETLFYRLHTRHRLFSEPNQGNPNEMSLCSYDKSHVLIALSWHLNTKQRHNHYIQQSTEMHIMSEWQQSLTIFWIRWLRSSIERLLGPMIEGTALPILQ